MTRFWLWILLTAAGSVAAFFGVCEWRTTLACSLSCGWALFLHSLFGEDA